jgi:hypothetical protein
MRNYRPSPHRRTVAHDAVWEDGRSTADARLTADPGAASQQRAWRDNGARSDDDIVFHHRVGVDESPQGDLCVGTDVAADQNLHAIVDLRAGRYVCARMKERRQAQAGIPHAFNRLEPTGRLPEAKKDPLDSLGAQLAEVFARGGHPEVSNPASAVLDVVVDKAHDD